MSDSIVQLGGSDFEEAIAHLSLVFNDPDFASLVPALYQPTDEHMGCNLALRRNGNIVAMVGLFPIEWEIGLQKLHLAGIGGVSVHPDFRGRGFMRLLMDATMSTVSRDGYHAACLGGNRRRYGYWGFEKAGVEASFLVTANSLEHSLSRDTKEAQGSLRVGPATDRDLPAMHALYRQLAVHCNRSAEAFPRHLCNWRRKPQVVHSENGRVIGYGCIDPNDGSCVECCCERTDALESLLRHQTASAGRPVRVSAPLIQDPLFETLDGLSDDCSLIEAGNWKINDWPAVIRALLKVKHASTPLPPGTCVLKPRPQSGSCASTSPEVQSFRLSVDNEAHCEPCDDRPDFEADPAELLRCLAAPLPSTLPPQASSLAAWRPLPLMIPMQDRI